MKDGVNTLMSWNFGITVVLVLAQPLMDEIGWDGAFILGMFGAVLVLGMGIWISVSEEDILWGVGGSIIAVLVGVICWRFNPNVAEVIACLALACGLGDVAPETDRHELRRYLSAIPAFVAFAWFENLGFWWGACAAVALFILQVRVIAPWDATPSEH